MDYEDECRLELTEKGHRVISLLAPEDLDHNLQNLKLQAKALKEEQRVSKVNQDDAGNLSIRWRCNFMEKWWLGEACIESFI